MCAECGCKVIVRWPKVVLMHNTSYGLEHIVEIIASGEYPAKMFSIPHLSNRNQPFAATMTAPVKILILDDDYGTSDLLRVILESGCFELMTTRSQEEGLELAKRTPPDVIVLVLNMPDDEGIALCKAFRMICAAPILVLSSNGRQGFAEKFLNEGADDYLVKPINNSVMVASINRLARRARAEQEANRANGDH